MSLIHPVRNGVPMLCPVDHAVHGFAAGLDPRITPAGFDALLGFESQRLEFLTGFTNPVQGGLRICSFAEGRKWKVRSRDGWLPTVPSATAVAEFKVEERGKNFEDVWLGANDETRRE